MSDFEEQLNSILNDPAQMNRIAAMAQSLMGGAKEEPTPPKERDFSMPDLGRLMAGLFLLWGIQHDIFPVCTVTLRNIAVIHSFTCL